MPSRSIHCIMPMMKLHCSYAYWWLRSVRFPDALNNRLCSCTPCSWQAKARVSVTQSHPASCHVPSHAHLCVADMLAEEQRMPLLPVRASVDCRPSTHMLNMNMCLPTNTHSTPVQCSALHHAGDRTGRCRWKPIRRQLAASGPHTVKGTA
jgi:hypothetical protein